MLTQKIGLEKTLMKFTTFHKNYYIFIYYNMLVRNFNSYNELEAKRQLNNQLLEIEAQNELENERRLKDYQNPNKPLPVPPQYRTNAEIKRDQLEQEKIAIQNVEELGFPYSQAGEVVAWLSSNGNADRLVKFNATFKGIKKELTETTNPRLLNTDFLKNYLERYFEDLDVNFGHKFSRGDIAGQPIPRTIEEIQRVLPDAGTITQIKDLIEGGINGFGLPQEIINDYETSVIIPLTELSAILPSQALLGLLKSVLNQKERSDIVKKLSLIARKIQLFSADEGQELLIQISRIINGGGNEREFTSFMEKLKRTLGFLTENNLLQLFAVIEPYVKELQSRGNVAPADALEENIQLQIDTADADNLPVINPPPTIPAVIGRTRSRGMDNPRSMLSKEQNLKDFLDELKDPVLAQHGSNTKGEKKKVIFDFVLPLINQGFIAPDAIGYTAQGQPSVRQSNIRDMINGIETYYGLRVNTQTSYNPVEKPQFRLTYQDGTKTIKGVGLTEKVIKHFKKDNKEMKALKKSYDKHIKTEDEVDMGSSSSDGESDNGKSGGRITFKHKRIKVGGGVKIKERPTYSHFGKYIIHIPYLMDKNLFNLKYPSMGSIPSIKPITISDDYKDLVLDVLENGKVNERQLKKLQDHEIRHFEKVVSGAGLNEVLNLKRGNTEQEKKDLDRYYLLRGEIDAGNNADKVIKELRGLIVKFMNDGRVHKSEGLNLLMELSVM